MRIILLAIILIWTSNSVIAQDKMLVPPGTMKLQDSLYIDNAPVTNMMFLEYLTAKHSLRERGFTKFSELQNSSREQFDAIITMYPTFLKNLNQDESILTKRHYFENIKYKYSPVLRISKEQAIDFCNWRTEMVMYLWSRMKKSDIRNIKYRLPSKSELVSAKEHFASLDQLRIDDGRNPMKFKTDKIVTDFIIYNISEFTDSEEFYGENWKKSTPANSPNDVTGFRCICEIQS